MTTTQPLTPRARRVLTRTAALLAQQHPTPKTTPQPPDPTDDEQTPTPSGETQEQGAHVSRALALTLLAVINDLCALGLDDKAPAALALRCAARAHDGVTPWPEYLDALADDLTHPQGTGNDQS